MDYQPLPGADEDCDGVFMFGHVHGDYISGGGPHLLLAIFFMHNQAAQKLGGSRQGVPSGRPPATPTTAGLRWLTQGGSPGSATQLLTASYDGSLRLLDVPSATWLDLSPGIPPDMVRRAPDMPAGTSRLRPAAPSHSRCGLTACPWLLLPAGDLGPGAG